MREEALEVLCCPLCHGALELEAEESRGSNILSGYLTCRACKRAYRVRNGVPDLLPREVLRGRDERWMRAYDRMARSYYIMMHGLIPALSLGTEPLARFRWVNVLGLRPGAVVLDIATGTGRNLPFLVRRVGRKGLIFAMDVSKGVIAYAARLIRAKRWTNVELQRANASCLPYKDSAFDGVLHVGGINTFEDRRRALAEMLRVAKPGARVVVVDEGLEPSRRKTLRGRLLLRMNALYASEPPVNELPEDVSDLSVEWGVVPSWAIPMWPFYVMSFRRPRRPRR